MTTRSTFTFLTAALAASVSLVAATNGADARGRYVPAGAYTGIQGPTKTLKSKVATPGSDRMLNPQPLPPKTLK
jgi:hypothetical protein